jgi:RNase P subunit RPR2
MLKSEILNAQHARISIKFKKNVVDFIVRIVCVKCNRVLMPRNKAVKLEVNTMFAQLAGHRSAIL